MDIITNQQKLVFVPRDAGFFSVFNFLIGSMTNSRYIYPYFNRQLFLKINRQNQHFAYWTDSDNCWFDYFEPIQYYDGDITHINRAFDGLKITVGEIAPEEFRTPAITHKLMRDKNRFEKWRKDTNLIYKKYIIYHKDILNKANQFIVENNLVQNTIAVHYRNPIHSCESGKIYFKDYFDNIDKLNKNYNIFLSTDSDLAILAFKDRYGDRLKYIPKITRLSIDNMLEWCYSLTNHKKIDCVGIVDGKGYELHQHLLNKQTNHKTDTINLLTEVMCMSKCKYMIYQISNIGLAISYMNPNIEMILIEGNNK